MKGAIAALVAGYFLSQFYRSTLAVLSPVLIGELGATPEDLGVASGLWLLTFAATQLPVGWSFDRIGPRRVTALLLALGGAGGTALFALAQGPGAVKWAMVLIGIGCAPVLMASYYLFARLYPPQMFATLGALVFAGGSLGNVFGSVPLAWSVGLIGWRATLWGFAGLTLAVSALLWMLIPDPPRQRPGRRGEIWRSFLLDRRLWLLLPLLSMNFVIPGAVRGIWLGPFLSARFGLGEAGIGWAALAMSLAMVAGSLAYGPLDRWLGTRKWVNFWGNLGSVFALMAVALWFSAPLGAVVALMALAGFLGSSFTLLMAHGRAFAPPHLTGQAVTLLNFISLGGAGVLQYASAGVFAATGNWTVLLLFLALPILLACLIYLGVEDRLD